MLSWAARGHRGFYMRSEDFFGFGLSTSARLPSSGRSPRRSRRAATPTRRSWPSGRRWRKSTASSNARSHGEGFFQVFAERFTPGGLYLLDEPEVALSPQRQIALLALMMETVAQEAQFVIATHAPMLMAYPGAQILHLSEEGIRSSNGTRSSTSR